MERYGKWIPSSEGMTERDAGMTERDAGMTVKGKNEMTDKKDKGITVLRSYFLAISHEPSAISRKTGFTLIEMLVVIIIAGILAAIGIPGFNLMISNHKFAQYSSNMEYLVKHAKIIAMEKTTNVGVCVPSSTQLILYNMGTNRAASICSGTEISNMTISSGDASGHNISVKGSASGYAFSFDPRGLAIMIGNVCVTNGSKYYKAVIDRAGIRMQEGTGGCS